MDERSPIPFQRLVRAIRAQAQDPHKPVVDVMRGDDGRLHRMRGLGESWCGRMLVGSIYLLHAEAIDCEKCR